MLSEELKGKRALVTGASRGIGQGIAHALANTGATVIGTATTLEGAEKITQHFKSLNLPVHGIVLNVTSSAAINEAMNQIKKQYGIIDILVNNAAITKDNLILRMKDEEWSDVLETDLFGVFYLMKTCLRDMLKARWGRIITIGSVVGTTGNPGQANYCAAKAGVIGLSKSLAAEVGSRNITVNVVAPGYVITDMTKILTDDQRKSILERIPMGKEGTVEDIAHAVVFLASPQAGYITGQTLHVNGGMHMN